LVAQRCFAQLTARYEGSAEALSEVEDLWMFARDVTSSDPNWKLVENNEAA